jgi:hypothetical protein
VPLSYHLPPAYTTKGITRKNIIKAGEIIFFIPLPPIKMFCSSVEYNAELSSDVFLPSAQVIGCVPGLARLLNGAVWYHVAVIMSYIPHKVQTQPDGGEGCLKEAGGKDAG